MIELLTNAEMAEADRLTIAGGMAGIELMENAGRAVADAAGALLQGRRVVVVAGPGNNGGDGFVAARHLAARGYAVRVSFVGDAKRLKGDAALAADRWSGPVEQASPGSLADCDIVIDALFGAGLDREVEGLPRAMIRAMNASTAPVLAVDLPSGVNGTTGAVMGIAVNATHTVTFFSRKTGHMLLPGRLHCGAIQMADIGIPDQVLEAIKPMAFANRPALWGRSFPQLRTDGHKYSRGHVVVVSGGLSTTGAARLAARGALRAQPGLVTVEPQPSIYIPVAAQLHAAMVRPWRAGRPLPKNATAILFGPGLAADKLPATLKRELRSHWKNFPGPMVVDASALDWLKPDATPAQAVRVITPHPGEAARLLGVTAKEVQANRVAALRQLSRRFSHCYVVLKGNHTLVGRAAGHIFINSSGNPLLAQGGSGDLLAGYLAGLLAQPACQNDPLTAIRFAVWQHGAAADENVQWRCNLTVEDMAQDLGSARP